MDVNRKKGAMGNTISASITFECSHSQEVKIISAELNVHSVDDDGLIQHGDLTIGVTLTVFSDDKFTIPNLNFPVTEDKLYIEAPVPLRIFR